MSKEALIITEKIKEPVRYNTHTLFNHISRYSIAIDRLNINKNDNVLDSSCASGYGTYCLSKVAYFTIGVDINKDYLKEAESCFEGEHIDFCTYKELKENMIGSFTKIVCIETFEHIEKEKQPEFIKMLLNELANGGDMFLTTPLNNDCPSEYNKFHLNEPSLNTLYKMLKDKFQSITFETSQFLNSFDKIQEYCYCICRNKI